MVLDVEIELERSNMFIVLGRIEWKSEKIPRGKTTWYWMIGLTALICSVVANGVEWLLFSHFFSVALLPTNQPNDSTVVALHYSAQGGSLSWPAKHPYFDLIIIPSDLDSPSSFSLSSLLVLFIIPLYTFSIRIGKLSEFPVGRPGIV